MQILQFTAAHGTHVLKQSNCIEPMPLRLHCSDQADADAAWRMLNHIPDHLWQPVEVHLDGHGHLCTITRDHAGDQTTAPAVVPLARKFPA